ncbi:ATPase with role in protein import into the ER [Ceratobasidium sp. 392]|nr:ATPase with role in protein import into the ER [Ceratobasidium sp. 392]
MTLKNKEAVPELGLSIDLLLSASDSARAPAHYNAVGDISYDAITSSGLVTFQLLLLIHAQFRSQMTLQWQLVDKFGPKTVGYGVTVQDGILSGEKGADDVVFIHTCLLPMGNETAGGVFTKLISRDAIVPTKKS